MRLGSLIIGLHFQNYFLEVIKIFFGEVFFERCFSGQSLRPLAINEGGSFTLVSAHLLSWMRMIIDTELYIMPVLSNRTKHGQAMQICYISGQAMRFVS